MRAIGCGWFGERFCGNIGRKCRGSWKTYSWTKTASFPQAVINSLPKEGMLGERCENNIDCSCSCSASYYCARLPPHCWCWEHFIIWKRVELLLSAKISVPFPVICYQELDWARTGSLERTSLSRWDHETSRNSTALSSAVVKQITSYFFYRFNDAAEDTLVIYSSYSFYASVFVIGFVKGA